MMPYRHRRHERFTRERFSALSKKPPSSVYWRNIRGLESKTDQGVTPAELEILLSKPRRDEDKKYRK